MSSIDLEDLIATFNTHHIGTEQMDLANLQAQLQQMLQAHTNPLPTSPVQVARVHPGSAPTNTPTARTPIWSQFADATHHRRRRSSSAASVRARNKGAIQDPIDDSHWTYVEGGRVEVEQDLMEDVEEEAEVDASLYATAGSSISSCSPSSPNTYVPTDPFLAAQLQAVEQNKCQPSFFTQIALARQPSSPFYSAVQQTEQLPSFAAPAPQGACFVSGTTMESRPLSLKIDTGSFR